MYTILLQALTLFLVTFIFFLVILYKIQVITNNESSIKQLQTDLLAQLQLLDMTALQQKCVADADLSLVREANVDYCNSSLSITNYSASALIHIDWIPSLQDKIDTNYIFYNAICLNDLVIHLLMNNPNITWPAPAFIPNDNFVNGLPHICFPGTNVGHEGISLPFQDIVTGFLNDNSNLTEVPPLRSILYFPPDSISAAIGNSFYLNNTIIQCYKTELYCYGQTAVYLFLAPS